MTGVQIADLTDEETAAIKRAWAQYGVLVFKDQQNLTPDDELAFAVNFPHSRTCSQLEFCGPLAKEGFDAVEWQKFKLRARPEIQLRGYGQLEDYFGVTGLLNTGKGVGC